MPHQDLRLGAPYKRGDFIGQRYEVYGVLGEGGFGIVYLVYARAMHQVYALKTFKDEFLADPQVRSRFEREANVWVDLGHHPYLIRAEFVEQISGRLYIGMEYVAPNEEGLNSMQGYLQRRPPDLAQSLRWAIEICLGMEHAYSKGVRAHRDLKPANVMIGQDKTAKITDFGLAGLLIQTPATPVIGARTEPLGARLPQHTLVGQGFGTPTHMAPEQYDDAAGCDERSDIYSFGIMLYELATHGSLPFLAPLPKDGSAPELEAFWQAMRRLHRESRIPRLDSPLSEPIRRCLEKLPEKRFGAFREVRDNLENLLRHETGEVIRVPKALQLRATEWLNKGNSLRSLERYEEALSCFEKALELSSPDDGLTGILWNNKAISLDGLGRHEDALASFDEALQLDPRSRLSWSNKGSSLGLVGHHEEAIACFDKAIEIDERFAEAWSNKASSLNSLGRHRDAILCCDRALELDPRYARAWSNRGISLAGLSEYEEAMHCFGRALQLDPRLEVAWIAMGATLMNLGRNEEAIKCLGKAIEFDPRNAYAWHNKALAEDNLGQWPQAALSYQQLLELGPSQLPNQLAHARKRLWELRA